MYENTYGDLDRIGVTNERDFCFEILALDDGSNKDRTVHGVTRCDKSSIR